MKRWRSIRGRLVLLSVLLVSGVSGVACGDDGDGVGDGDGDEPDGATLAEAFGEAAETAYDELGGDRQEDFTQGAVLDDCFVLDADAPPAIAEALGVDDPAGAELVGRHFISGPPDRRERLTCTIDLAETEATVLVAAGTVTLDRDGLLEETLQNAEQLDTPREEVEGETPGLDSDHVLAVAEEGVGTTVMWVDGGFHVTLSVANEVVDPDAAFRALPVLVDAVAASLDGS